MGTGETLTEICARKPQSERDALLAQAKIQSTLVRMYARAAKDWKAADRKNPKDDYKARRASCRVTCKTFLDRLSATRKLLREMGE